MNFAKVPKALRAIDDVSFHIGAGEPSASSGRSGCGKTVTALSIAKLFHAAGELRRRRNFVEWP